MTHRIERKDTVPPRLEFHGLLDRAAFEAIAASVRAARRNAPGSTVVLALAAGTDVDSECVEPLRRLEGVVLEPVSPFLARWLRRGA